MFTTPQVSERVRAGAVADVEWIDAPTTVREAFPERRPNCDPRVPYERMGEAVSEAWAAYPDATNIVALYTPTSSNDVCVEIWRGDRARVLAAHRIGVAL